MATQESLNIFTLYSYDTDFSADSVEWCPHDPNKNLFSCATYQLKENELVDKPKERVGKILLFSISQHDGLTLHQTTQTSAVLDQKWCHNQIDNASVLGVAKANKKLYVYKLNSSLKKLEVVASIEIQGDKTDNLILSLDWSSGRTASEEPQIVCSDSNGSVHLLNFSRNRLVLNRSFRGHDFEAWIAAFYYFDTNCFFSGGDDSVLLKFDSRLGDQPILKNKRHSAGVTAVHSNSSKEFVVATGSYDEKVRLWDIRSMKEETGEISMPGPLWRVKWDPFKQDVLLVACMLGGVHVVDLFKLEIVASFYGHESLAYGVDWSYLGPDFCAGFEGRGDFIIGSCSFYDHLLCVSKFDNVER